MFEVAASELTCDGSRAAELEEVASGASQRVAAAQKHHPPRRSCRRHSQTRLVNQLAPASDGVRRRAAVSAIERKALYCMHTCRPRAVARPAVGLVHKSGSEKIVCYSQILPTLDYP